MQRLLREYHRTRQYPLQLANTLRLVNDSNATTKGGANNLNFELVTADKVSTGGGSGGNNPDGGGSDGDQGENPLG